MLNKNANCYNIKKYFKYSTIISTFREHIIKFRTLSIDIWQLKCQQQQTNKSKNGEFFIANFSELYFWEKPLWNQNLLLLTATAQRSCYPPVNWVVFHFSQIFLELIFATKIKTMLLKQLAVLFTSCQKNIVHIMCLNT